MTGDFWTGRVVTVTGAGGFIGSHLVESLVRSGARVRAFVRYNSRGTHGWLDQCGNDVVREVELFRGDLVNPEAVAGALTDVDTVLHLGALIPIPYSYRHPREFVETNVVGTLNVLEACRRVDVRRIVQISSSEVYGTAQSVPIHETHPLNAQSPYAATKVGADQLALSYQHVFDLPVVVARPFNTYGPRQTARAVIPTIIGQALRRGSVELGATDTTRDFVFVEDTCAGIMRCAQADGVEGEVINLGTGVETTIAEVVDRVQRLLGHEVAVVQDESRMRPPGSEVERLLADASKAEQLLGWSARTDLDDGLRLTIDWFKRSIDEYNDAVYHL